MTMMKTIQTKSEEEERPILKRVNRIDSDDSESEEEVKKSPSEKETEETVGKGQVH